MCVLCMTQTQTSYFCRNTVTYSQNYRIEFSWKMFVNKISMNEMHSSSDACMMLTLFSVITKYNFIESINRLQLAMHSTLSIVVYFPQKKKKKKLAKNIYSSSSSSNIEHHSWHILCSNVFNAIYVWIYRFSTSANVKHLKSNACRPDGRKFFHAFFFWCKNGTKTNGSSSSFIKIEYAEKMNNFNSESFTIQ